MKTVVLMFAALSGIPVCAGIILDQSPPNQNSTDMVNYRLADDFSFTAAATVDAVNFWYQAEFQSDLSNLSYAFYADASGALGSMLYSGTVTPVTSFDATNDAFFGTFAVSDLAFSAGTYWLELHAGTSLTDDNGSITVWWSAADDNGTYDALFSPSPAAPASPIGVSGFEQYAFQLDGTGGGGASAPLPSSDAPDPSTLWLGAPALALLRFRRKRL